MVDEDDPSVTYGATSRDKGRLIHYVHELFCDAKHESMLTHHELSCGHELFCDAKHELKAKPSQIDAGVI